MFCSKCGANITADSAFCQTCGTPVPRALAVASAPGGVVTPHSGVGAIAYVSSVVYAGFWLRLVAHLIDSLILAVFTMALFIPFFVLIGGTAFLTGITRRVAEERPGPEQVAPFVMILVTLVGIGALVQWLYFAYLESGEKQGSWGKQVMSLYVTDLEGNRISFGRASGRFFAKIISGMIPLAIGYIMAGFTERKQALHDMIAGTLVLRR